MRFTNIDLSLSHPKSQPNPNSNPPASVRDRIQAMKIERSDPFVSRWFGLVPYQEALSLQMATVEEVVLLKEKIRILGFEHPPVITLGKRSNKENRLNEGELKPTDGHIEIIYTDRGGQATLHSPGQLVIYPILALDRLNISVREFVSLLEESTISFLKKYGVKGKTIKERPGVFTEKGKIAFLGLRISRGVSYHGLSINIKNDLNLFQGISPCGMINPSLDRLCDQQRHMDMDFELSILFQEWSKIFRKNLG